MDELTFLVNKLVQDAVIRNFEVIGEAPDGHPNSPTFGHLKLPHLN